MYLSFMFIAMIIYFLYVLVLMIWMVYCQKNRRGAFFVPTSKRLYMVFIYIVVLIVIAPLTIPSFIGYLSHADVNYHGLALYSSYTMSMYGLMANVIRVAFLGNLVQ